jgi:hypothetical protein
MEADTEETNRLLAQLMQHKQAVVQLLGEDVLRRLEERSAAALRIGPLVPNEGAYAGPKTEGAEQRTETAEGHVKREVEQGKEEKVAEKEIRYEFVESEDSLDLRKSQLEAIKESIIQKDDIYLGSEDEH